MEIERIIRVRPRTVSGLLGIVLVVAAVLRRGAAVVITFVVALLVVAGFIASIVPTLYDQVTNLADKRRGTSTI